MPRPPPSALQIVSAAFIGDGDVEVRFTGPVAVADWTPSWFQVDNGGEWNTGAVEQFGVDGLLFRFATEEELSGRPWRLVGHPPALSPPYTGVLT